MMNNILSDKFLALVETMSKLRKECPWDKKQTHQSLRKYILEEAYEVVESIDQEKWIEYIKKPEPVFEMPLWEEHLELDDLTSLYEKIMKSFYLSPRQIVQRLLEIKSWHQLTTYIKVGLATIKIGHRRSAISQNRVLVR